ncbi:hypothetical protein [Clostridioides difficile]|uniref:hypothetical protein n=1 Tax=Clostridioides difficile TaxID=1496 RepID=UPI0018A9FC88|nr:hypothetical protein [Clostridioides difficile]MBF8994282.1 hypothetical protein [Clostridioides difficile]
MLIVPGGTQYDGGRGYCDEWDGVFGCGGGSILGLEQGKYPYNLILRQKHNQLL